jgi:hypothetical protein
LAKISAIHVLDLTLINAALEETVRWDTSTQCLARDAMADVEVAGVRIPAGSRALLYLASANRDERAFEDPDRSATLSRGLGRVAPQNRRFRTRHGERGAQQGRNVSWLSALAVALLSHQRCVLRCSL